MKFLMIPAAIISASPRTWEDQKISLCVQVVEVRTYNVRGYDVSWELLLLWVVWVRNHATLVLGVGRMG